MFGKFKCRQCDHKKNYNEIVKENMMCLDCYAWAKTVQDRNKNRPPLARELQPQLDILLIGYNTYPFGEWKMLTRNQAEYILSHEIEPRPVMCTCKVCNQYRHADEMMEDLCSKCHKKIMHMVNKVKSTQRIKQ